MDRSFAVTRKRLPSKVESIKYADLPIPIKSRFEELGEARESSELSGRRRTAPSLINCLRSAISETIRRNPASGGLTDGGRRLSSRPSSPSSYVISRTTSASTSMPKRTTRHRVRAAPRITSGPSRLRYVTFYVARGSLPPLPLVPPL